MRGFVRRFFALAFAFATAFFSTALRAETFDWPGHGKISLTVPDGWSVRGKPSKLSFDLVAKPKDAFVVSVQLTLLDSQSGEPLKAEQLKTGLEMVTRKFVKRSVEKVFAPKPLTLSQGSGLMADFTDASRVGKALKPGNYKVLRSGIAFLDENAMLGVTILFNDSSRPEVEQAMLLLSSFHLERGAAAGRASIKSGEPFTFTVPESHVIVKISDPSLHADHTAPLGPNYFKVSRHDPPLILSGWLSPASAYKGMKWFWDAESRALASKSRMLASNGVRGTLAPVRVEMLRVGPWEVVAYDIPLSRIGDFNGADVNLRAERVLAGTWIDLHLSKASNEPPAKLRTELLDALKQVDVVEK